MTAHLDERQPVWVVCDISCGNRDCSRFARAIVHQQAFADGITLECQHCHETAAVIHGVISGSNGDPIIMTVAAARRFAEEPYMRPLRGPQ